MPRKEKTAGGQGATAPTEAPSRAEMVLAAAAFRGQWPITDEVREAVLKSMVAVLGSTENDRDRIGAAKVIVAADLANVKREAIEQKESQPTGPMIVVVQHQDGWYDNPAAATAARAAASALGSIAPGPVQGLGVRPAVGEDGAGVAGDDSGPRSTKRRKARGA
jgi:hypothetical protein